MRTRYGPGPEGRRQTPNLSSEPRRDPPSEAGIRDGTPNLSFEHGGPDPQSVVPKRPAPNLSFGEPGQYPVEVERRDGTPYLSFGAVNPQSVVQLKGGPQSVVPEPPIRRPGALNPSSQPLNLSFEPLNLSFERAASRWAATVWPVSQSLSKPFKNQSYKGD